MHNNFVVGNVLQMPFAQIVAIAPDTPYVKDFVAGVKKCKVECEYFSVCLGGQASNKYFENGDISTTKTQFCVNSHISVVDAILETI